jgi:hypothetical protein
MAIDGVASVEADFNAKTATVAMKPGQTLTQTQCDKAFEGSRYTVASFAEIAGAAANP